MDEMRYKDMLNKIRELEFAAIDLNLYLDNHPMNQQALMDYNTVAKELTELKRMYEAESGPLIHFGCAPSSYPWRWVDEPWPWENED